MDPKQNTPTFLVSLFSWLNIKGYDNIHFLKLYKMFKFGYILSPGERFRAWMRRGRNVISYRNMPLALFFCSFALVGAQYSLCKK